MWIENKKKICENYVNIKSDMNVDYSKGIHWTVFNCVEKLNMQRFTWRFLSYTWATIISEMTPPLWEKKDFFIWLTKKWTSGFL